MANFRLVTNFGIIPFQLQNIRVDKDTLKDIGVIDKVTLLNGNITPYLVSQRFYSTQNKWQQVLDVNGVEPFSFYYDDTPEDELYKSVSNINLY